MIKINLVPPHLRKRENLAGMGILNAVDLPKEVFWGVGGLFITFLLLLHIVLLLVWGYKTAQHAFYQITWQKMLPERKNIDSINQELNDLRTRMSTINDITSKKTILWSQKLNIISNVLPKGMWLRKVTWDNNVLSMEGSVFSRSHDEIGLVGTFVSNLKQEEGFMKEFLSVEVGAVTRAQRGITEIANFTVIAKIK